MSNFGALGAFMLLEATATGAALLGATGLIFELTTKGGHPDSKFKIISDVFARTMQNLAAVLALTLAAGIFIGPVAVPIALVAGAVVVMTPTIAALVKEHSNSTKVKRVVRILDQSFNIGAKIVNIGVVTLASSLYLGVGFGVAAGLGMTALSAVALYRK